MLTRTFVLLCRYPPLRKLLWRQWYQFLARHYRGGDWTFMNYGYAETGSRELFPLRPEDERDRHPIQLYRFVAGAADLSGRNVLEVGSGRGGGSSFMMRYLKPAAVTGVDFSRNAVEFCRQTHVVSGLSFTRGDAEALPFGDESFDAVVNVESSHCYGSMQAFLSQVRRVLRPKGYFLHADLRQSEGADVWRNQLDRSGMDIIRESDITANVLLALDADHDFKAALISRLLPLRLHAAAADFAALRGSSLYEGFRSGAFVYRSYMLQKP